MNMDQIWAKIIARNVKKQYANMPTDQLAEVIKSNVYTKAVRSGMTTEQAVELSEWASTNPVTCEVNHG